MPERKTIFIVEDEPMIGLMLEDFLESLGYGLSGLADTLESGCSAARAGGFDAAILDCNLHGDKVWPVAEVLIEKNVPFLFATGGSSDDIPAHFTACPTLEKPFTMANVESALQQLFPDE
ncbi:response regulator [Rhizorhapis sp. SPR117]|uniref:response regulator n=1 Tax=Rhizorhapis sp. SPR117 TaxID=2912611 RepID=UPI001F3DE60B|nr:response regulator [Rhizorhapis sp. SPR117]